MERRILALAASLLLLTVTVCSCGKPGVSSGTPGQTTAMTTVPTDPLYEPTGPADPTDPLDPTEAPSDPTTAPYEPSDPPFEEPIPPDPTAPRPTTPTTPPKPVTPVPSDIPQVTFGKEASQQGIRYQLIGAQALSVGSILGKEYVKLDKQAVSLRFTFEKETLEKIAGKPFHLMLEYYDGSSKDFTLSYATAKGLKSTAHSMSATSMWGGKSVKITDFQRDDRLGYDFAIGLPASGQLWLHAVWVVEAAAGTPAYPQLLKTSYANSNGTVIAANVRDYGARGDGKLDDSVAFQTALRAVAADGGAVYVPAGTYRLTQEMVLPSGVTLLGDYKQPTEQDPKVGGTILAMEPVSTAAGNTKEFFQMQQGSSLNGFTLWYPQQTMQDGAAVAYPYAICNTQPSATTIENLHMVNVYNGIDHNKVVNQHQTTLNISGTPLRNGIRIGQVNDSGRDEKLDFRPEWWLKSGLPGAPGEAVLKNWLMRYGVAFQIVKIDWHFLADLTVKGYNIGLRIDHFFGRAYNLNITECNTCVYVPFVTRYGGQLTNGVLKASGGENPVALRVGESVENGISCNAMLFESAGERAIEVLGTGALSIQDSTVKLPGSGRAGIYNKSGRLTVMNTLFYGGQKHIEMAQTAGKSSVINCSAKSGALVCEAKNAANLTVKRDAGSQNVTLDRAQLARQDALRARQDPQPAKQQLFIAADYGVKANGQDVAAALQKAIDAAAKAGGGTVYVAKGEYRLEAPVVVRSGVELLGSTDYLHYINAPTTFFLTDYSQGGEQGQPLFTLEQRAGARGFSVCYDKVRQETIKPCPPTFQGKGSDVYLMNVAVAGAWIVADFDTYRCDSHYLDGVMFAAFKTGIAVGGGSKNGVVRYCHANPAVVINNPFTDSKSWSSEWTGPLIVYLTTHATGFYVGETTNETMFFCFIFGSLNGLWADTGADVYTIGHGTDYSRRGMYFTGNARVTAIDPQLSGATSSNAVLADTSFTGTAAIYNASTWAIQDAAVRVKNGTVRLSGGIFFQCGKAALIAEGGDTTMSGVITVTRSLADLQALAGARSVCAYGNLPLKTPRFEVAAGVKKTGLDVS